MQIESLGRTAANIKELSNPAQVLRRWCTPDTILAVTNFFDEDPLLFHILRQARKGATKIILIHADLPYKLPSRKELWGTERDQRSHPGYFAQLALARMARKLTWVGLNCEPILRAFNPAEVSALVKLRGVDRVILSGVCGESSADIPWRIFTDQLIHEVEVPVCLIGGQTCVDLPRIRHVGRVSLALSPDSDCELALAFASRFAQEHRSKLTIVHVLSQLERDETRNRPPTASFSLPAGTLREAELFCALDITVRVGDPVTEILTCDTFTDQDFIILRCAGPASSSQSNCDTVSQRIIKEARCPVIILGRPRAVTACEGDSAPLKRKTSQAIEELGSATAFIRAKECA